MANVAIKYMVYPTREQAILFAKTFGCCRKIWNLMLADKIESYQQTGKFTSPTPAHYKKQYPYLKEVDSLALANKQLDLQQAFRNRFSKKRKKKNGFPKFKSAKHSRKSYTTNNQNGTIAILDKAIKLPKVGLVKAVIHRLPENEWMIKSATVSQTSDGTYYVSVLFEYEAVESAYIVNPSNAIGLDYKSDGLFTDSNGYTDKGHRYFRTGQKKLAKAQKKLKHKTIGSNNYKKQQLRIARIHAHIANQRKDHLHKKSTEIANQYDVVCVESLNMKALSNKKFGNGKATMDNGYGMFLTMLDYKLKNRGKVFIKVDKWYPSSQLCSQCGRQHKLALNERIYRCECGLVMDRDMNAAINIRNEGLRLLEAGA